MLAVLVRIVVRRTGQLLQSCVDRLGPVREAVVVPGLKMTGLPDSHLVRGTGTAYLESTCMHTSKRSIEIFDKRVVTAIRARFEHVVRGEIGDQVHTLSGEHTGQRTVAFICWAAMSPAIFLC